MERDDQGARDGQMAKFDCVWRQVVMVVGWYWLCDAVSVRMMVIFAVWQLCDLFMKMDTY